MRLTLYLVVGVYNAYGECGLHSTALFAQRENAEAYVATEKLRWSEVDWEIEEREITITEA